MQTVSEWIYKITGRDPSLLYTSELRLNNYFVKEVHCDIGSFKNLVSLNLCGNLLSRLPESLVSLQRLKFLYLCSNDLSDFPLVITCLSELRTLEIGHNRIETIPSEIERMSNLQYLTVKYNLLRALPIEMNKLQELRFIDLRGNISLERIRCRYLQVVQTAGTSVLYVDIRRYFPPNSSSVHICHEEENCKLCVIQSYLCELQFYLDNNELPL